MLGKISESSSLRKGSPRAWSRDSKCCGKRTVEFASLQLGSHGYPLPNIFQWALWSQPPRGHPSDLQNLGAALAAQSAQDQAPGFSCAGCGYGFLAIGLHLLVVIVLPGQDLAVWIITRKEKEVRPLDITTHELELDPLLHFRLLIPETFGSRLVIMKRPEHR